jgi:hypothetical protein
MTSHSLSAGFTEAPVPVLAGKANSCIESARGINMNPRIYIPLCLPSVQCFLITAPMSDMLDLRGTTPQNGAVVVLDEATGQLKSP